MPRPPKKPKPGAISRVPVLLSAELVQAIDKLAEQLGAERFTTSASRTDAIRLLLVEGLRKRGLLK